MNLAIDYIPRDCYKSPHPCSFGACSRGIPEYGARSGVPRWRFATAAPGGTGPRPPGTTTRTRGARCDRSGSDSGEGSAGPEPKIATVERREAGVPRMGTQGASLGAWPARVMGRPNGCLASTRRLSALRHPVNSGERSQKRKTRAQKTRRGNEETCAV